MTENSASHKRERRRWLPVVARGDAYCSEPVCLMSDRWLDPSQPWDLSHDHAAGYGYLGPSHPACNRAEGAARGNRQRARDKVPEAQGVGRWRL
jgi:hypothetical protein